MSFNPNDITLQNYEEAFVLYVDNELDAAGRKAVEAFAVLHPHLGDELQALMATQLTADETIFFNKEDLLSPAMKLNAVDEDLLLYVDHELPRSGRQRIEQKIETDHDYASQHALLMKAKLDPAEAVPHPAKKELYRHSERVVAMRTWLRVAVAAVLLLSGGLFFLKNDKPVESSVVVNPPSPKPPLQKQIERERLPVLPLRPPQNNDVATTATDQNKKYPVTVSLPRTKKEVRQQVPVIPLDPNPSQGIRRDVVKIETPLPRQSPTINLPVNKTIAHSPVTSTQDVAFNGQRASIDIPGIEEAEDVKPQKNRSLLRKVSKFVQRSTGLGTANKDGEVLVGVFTVKLN